MRSDRQTHWRTAGLGGAGWRGEASWPGPAGRASLTLSVGHSLKFGAAPACPASPAARLKTKTVGRECARRGSTPANHPVASSEICSAEMAEVCFRARARYATTPFGLGWGPTGGARPALANARLACCHARL